MRKKLLVVLLTAVTAAGILAGCGSRAEDTLAVVVTAGTDAEAETETQENTWTAGTSEEVTATEETKTTEPAEAGMTANAAEKEVKTEVVPEVEVNTEAAKVQETDTTSRIEPAPTVEEVKEAVAEVASPEPTQEVAPSTIEVSTSDWISLDTDMLALVNADRVNNGVSELVWSDSLAQYCLDRLPIANYNHENGLWMHEGYTKRENLAWGALPDSEFVNQGWINSEGHHSARIDGSYTSYAAAAFMDSDTGLVIWIEAFE